MGIIELENKVKKAIDKTKLSLGITVTQEESEKMLIEAYNKANEVFPERYFNENAVMDPCNIIDMGFLLGKQKKKYYVARSRYIEHAECCLNRRGLAEVFPDILPPYVIFPEQSGSLSHGDCSKAYETYLKSLKDAELKAHFKRFPLPRSYQLRIEDEALAQRIQRCINELSAGYVA